MAFGTNTAQSIHPNSGVVRIHLRPSHYAGGGSFIPSGDLVVPSRNLAEVSGWLLEPLQAASGPSSMTNGRTVSSCRVS